MRLEKLLCIQRICASTKSAVKPVWDEYFSPGIYKEKKFFLPVSAIFCPTAHYCQM
jgi:hypothetical protein